MQRTKILKKIVSSSSMTIGSSIMSAEIEIQNSEQNSQDINIDAFVEQLKELEAKSDTIIDDEDDDKPLFFKKKKETGTQTPGNLQGPSAHLTDSIHHKPVEHHHMNNPTNLGVGVTGLKQQGRKFSTVIPQGNEKAQVHHSSEPKGEEMSMSRRESRFGIPGIENSGAGAFLRKHRASIAKLGNITEVSSENDQSPPKEASRKGKVSLRGFLQKFNKEPAASSAKVSLFGNMDASTVADIQDQLSRAREIQRKGIELELRCETLEKQESDMARRLHDAEEEMERMRMKYANMDELVEEKYRQYVLEQQMLMQMRKKRAGGSQWLENLSEMDRKAEEKRMIMKMRAASHAKKRADARAAEEAAAEEKRRQIEKEKEDALNYDSDEEDKKRKKNFRPKMKKLIAKGENQKTRGDMKTITKRRDIKEPDSREQTTVISATRLNELLAAAKSRLKVNNIRVRAVDVADSSTSTEDLTLVGWETMQRTLMSSPSSAGGVCDLRSPTPMLLSPASNDTISEASFANIDLDSQNPSPPQLPPRNNPKHDEIKDSMATIEATNKTSKEYSKMSTVLHNSDNPIFELFIRYGPIMNNDWNAKLLRAAALEASMRAPKAVGRVFDYVSDEIKQIEAAALDGLHDITLCEKSVSQLAELKRTGNTQHSLFRDSIVELYKLLGTLQAKSVLTDFKLGEHRSLFESLSVVETAVDLGSCEEFGKCYGVFLIAQGKAIELSNRLLALKEVCDEYGLRENLDLHLPILATNPNTASDEGSVSRGLVGRNMNESMYTNDFQMISSGDVRGNTPGYNIFPSRGNTHDQNLHKELEEALEEIEDLRTEMFAIEQQKDRTPGALIFFAGLYDPNAIHAIASLIENMKNLQGIAMCKEHVDFQDLRQRILTCLTNLPPMERLLLKFNKMHSKWTESRYKLFSSRNQAGGDADATYTCPLCAHDGRAVSLSPLPNSPVKRGNNVNKDSDSRKESSPDFTVSSKMVISPFAKSMTSIQKSPSKGSIGSSSPTQLGIKNDDKKAVECLPPNTPPLRLNSPATVTPDRNLLLGMNEDLHRKAIMNRVKNKNW